MVLSSMPTLETQFSLKMKQCIDICSILITLDMSSFADMLGFLNLRSEMTPRTKFPHLIETFQIHLLVSSWSHGSSSQI